MKHDWCFTTKDGIDLPVMARAETAEEALRIVRRNFKKRLSGVELFAWVSVEPNATSSPTAADSEEPQTRPAADA